MNRSVGRELKGLEDLLDQMDEVAHAEDYRVTVEDILTAIGSRSFAPLLLLVGALIASPLSGVPTFPTAAALLVFLVSSQLLMGRQYFWLPGWLRRAGVPQKRLIAALNWLRSPARVIDRFIRPRLRFLVSGPAVRLIAVFTLVIAAGMPLLEFIPFSASLAGVALAAFGLALVSNDGLLALIAYVATAATIWLFFYGRSLLFA